jgi:uncharacterized repeat protein (TIGR01451 family)
MNSLFLTLTVASAALVPAQPSVTHAPPAQAPLLFVKVIGPEGMHVTFHPGTPGAKAIASPAMVGLRPGYVYRVELTLPGRPTLKLYPTIEVRGALNTSLDRAMRHPVPIVFHEDELDRVDRAASMITKVHYLEDPLMAQPVASTPDEPPLLDVPNDTDPVEEGRLHGRLMAIVRLGERQPLKEELARNAVPNTILFPGEQRLTLPPLPPTVPWLFMPIYDPIIGAKLGMEECLPDGGDVGARIGIGEGNKLGGLDPSDAAIEYTTESGKRKVAVSNRVCVFVPRYAVARQEVTPAANLFTAAPGTTVSTKTTQRMSDRQRADAASGVKQPAEVEGRKGVSGMQGFVRLHGFDNTKGVQIMGSIAGVQTIGAVKEPEEITASPFCEPISLFKWSDPREAQVGDVVTFYLRFTNHTKQPVDHLAVTDSLVARLDYLPGTAKTDREAALTVTPNEVGSVTLRWELTGQLPPGASGVIAFQARVR